MKKLFIALMALISINTFGQSDSCCQYAIMVRTDTTCNKDGLAFKGGVFYIGNHVRWSQILDSSFNGISKSLGAAVLGQDTGASNDPAALRSYRKIPMAGKDITFYSPNFGDGAVQIGQNNTVYVTPTGNAAKPKLLVTAWDNAQQYPMSGVSRDDGFCAIFDKRTVLENNNYLSFFKGAAIIRDYAVPDSFARMPESDYQHNVFACTFGGGFKGKPSVPVQNIVGGDNFFHSTTSILSKFLYNDRTSSKNVTGFISNVKFLFETECGGITQNYADLVLGGIARLPGGESHIFTNKVGLYVLPVKADLNVTNGWGIYQEGKDDKNYFAGRAAFGDTSTSSAQLEVSSTTKGFLPPRLTTVQRDAIDSPALGLQVHNLTTKQPEFYDGSVWRATGSTSLMVVSDSDYTVTPNVGSIVFDTMTTNRMLTLPTASNNLDRILVIKNGGAGSFIINLSVSIKESATTSISAIPYNRGYTIQSNGISWYIINESN